MTPQDTLNDLLIERQLKLLRLAKSREKVVVELLRDYLADIEATIAKRRTPASETLTVIQKSLKELLAPFSDDIAKALEFEKLAQVEADNAVAMLDKATGAKIAVTVSAARVAEVAHKSVVAGLPISDWFQDYEDKLIQDISRAVRVGVAGGKTMREISQDLGALLPDVKESSVKTMARTLTFGLAANARQVVYDENTDIVQGWIQVSTLDSRTTLLCAARDNLAWDKDKQPVGHNQDFQQPPLHPNCLTGDTEVLACSDISNIYKRTYEGVIINFTTKSGRSISITPNHPVLTSAGWKAAKFINAGDKLACVFDVAGIVRNKKNSVIAKFSDLFAAFSVPIDAFSITNRPSSPEYFHGDGADGEISVINVDSLSRDGITAKLRAQYLKNIRFKFALGVNKSFFSLCSFDFFLPACSSTTTGIMSFFGKLRYLLRSGAAHSCRLLLAPISSFSVARYYQFCNCRDAESVHVANASYTNPFVIKLKDKACIFMGKVLGFTPKCDVIGNKDSLYWLGTNAEHIGDVVNAVPIGIEFDDVVSVNINSEFVGHVYNLECESNWYVSNGIITHNCRSLLSPWLYSADDLPKSKRDKLTPSTRASMDGQVPASKTFEEFLTGKGEAWQREYLGESRYNLWKSGKIKSLQDFITPDGRTIRLDDL